ncbi:MAG: cysteine--tRNA ligase [Candidatus Roizmanbacteria bacterium]|nr:cysteine--tRNA ligase [Candidatus Roizmanbacteria bacterium]
MNLYNTLTRTLEPFTPLKDHIVTLYQCGPTVYWTQHIGNMRAMVMGDLVIRSLRYLGYEVTSVRNYTDVGHLTSDADTGEDKMSKGAKKEGLTPDEIADKYIAQFEHDVSALNCIPPTVSPRATHHIPEMIAVVSALLKKGIAYETDSAVYFSVERFGWDRYTKLSRQKKQDLVAGAGKGDVQDQGKRNQADFALWFFRTGAHAQAMQYWPSPFHSSAVPHGEGFPGWHIECSAMSMKYLGETLDVHMGGVEHISIHHSNEIAQSEATTGKPFVRYWLHNEHLLVNGEKMAKSQGTGLSLEALIKRHFHPLSLRYFFLQAHYRSQQNFTYESLGASQQALNNLLQEAFIIRVRSTQKGKPLSALVKRFKAAIEDDNNVPQALATVWETINITASPEDRYATLLNFDQVLGLDIEKYATIPVPENIQSLLETRNDLRSKKAYDEADALRERIEKEGFVLDDTPEGAIVKPKDPLAFDFKTG